MNDRLLREVYENLYENRVMDGRRIKRLIRLDPFMETVHKGIACAEQSREFRLAARQRGIPVHRAIFGYDGENITVEISN